MRKAILIPLLYSFEFFLSCNGNKSNLNLKPTQEKELITLKTTEAFKTSNDTIINIPQDDFFKTKKAYRGYDLKKILDSIIAHNRFDTTELFLVFQCKDGYTPILKYSLLDTISKAYIVYKDMDQPKGKNWPDSVAEKFKPFYLVWSNINLSDHDYIWPYGIINIRLVSNFNEYNSIFPIDDKSVIEGFNLTVKNCLKCHTINNIGGKMCPELNYPKNITEYWVKDDIKLFIKDPKSFRYNSKMPAITNLSENNIDDIIKYLGYIKKHKKLN